MKDTIDDALNAIMGVRSNYTLEEIEKAQKLKKKKGGTLMENLEEVTGRGLPSMSTLMEEHDKLTALNKELDSFSGELNDYKKESVAFAADKPKETLSEADSLKEFNGIADVVSSKVFGQDDFIKKLVIAFKRPFVLAPETGLKNTIFITGGSCTGKHCALKALVSELAGRRVLRSSDIKTIDLSLYQSADDEKLFLQDLYSALNSASDVILFENYESCHTSFLSRLTELISKGSCTLSERYIAKEGNLVNVNNALAEKSVGSISAKGKYLVFISSRNLTKLADKMGAPFVNALGDICESAALDECAYKQISEKELSELKDLSKDKCGFNLSVDDEFMDYSISMAGKQAGLKGILSFYEDILKALAQLRLESDYDMGCDLLLDVDNETMFAVIGEERKELFAILPGKYTGELEAVKKELDGIVGLEEIKKYILSLEEYYGVQKLRREAGLKAGEVSKHMIFTGNPGTGKTTIARVISRYLKAIGILSGGQLVEVSRADLVGKYVGHTAPLTNNVISSAIGGVLFIDEAYSLYRGKDDSFGLEAIDTLVKGIEDNRDNLIVILAGYSNEMEEFLTSNSGLKSRFPNVINFPDYTGQELLDIAKITAGSKGYTIDEGAYTSLLTYFNAVQAVRAKDAGNGRLVRNKVEEAVLAQSKRLVKDRSADLSTLISEDFDLSDVNGD
ncbi:MAG: AAA family ATPase [Lachnospiraceae bacterium]|nr:AAA family ATPase [Lachnospiraceae bacterium]